MRLVDVSGGGGSVTSYLSRTYVPPLPGFADQVAALEEIPVVTVALGSVAGLGAARVAMSHFSVMVEGLSQIFTAGPPIVRYATHGCLEAPSQLSGLRNFGDWSMCATRFDCQSSTSSITPDLRSTRPRSLQRRYVTESRRMAALYQMTVRYFVVIEKSIWRRRCRAGRRNYTPRPCRVAQRRPGVATA